MDYGLIIRLFFCLGDDRFDKVFFLVDVFDGLNFHVRPARQKSRHPWKKSTYRFPRNHLIDLSYQGKIDNPSVLVKISFAPENIQEISLNIPIFTYIRNHEETSIFYYFLFIELNFNSKFRN